MRWDPEEDETSGDASGGNPPPPSDGDYYGHEDMDLGLREGDLSDLEYRGSE